MIDLIISCLSPHTLICINIGIIQGYYIGINVLPTYTWLIVNEH